MSLGKADLQSLCRAGEMASTWTMSIFTMWMEYSLPQEVSNQFWIIDPLQVQLAKQSNKVEEILGRVQEWDYVFIPTLHDGHWVLWVKMRNNPIGKVTSKVVFCDPLNNPASNSFAALGDLAVKHISTCPRDHLIIRSRLHHELRIPRQPNGTDCGFYVMQTIRMLVEEFIQGLGSPDFVSIYTIWNLNMQVLGFEN